MSPRSRRQRASSRTAPGRSTARRCGSPTACARRSSSYWCVAIRLQSLASRIEELQAKLEDTNYRLSQLSQQIAATNQELKTYRPPEAPAPSAPPAAGAPPTPIVVDPKSLYDGAYNDYLAASTDQRVKPPRVKPPRWDDLTLRGTPAPAWRSSISRTALLGIPNTWMLVVASIVSAYAPAARSEMISI